MAHVKTSAKPLHKCLQALHGRSPDDPGCPSSVNSRPSSLSFPFLLLLEANGWFTPGVKETNLVNGMLLQALGSRAEP